MPIFRANLTTGQAYGAGEVFDPGQTGAKFIQVRLNSIRFHTTVAVDFSYSTRHPTDASNIVQLFQSTGTDLSDDTSRILAVESDGASWVFAFTSGTLGADAFLTLDYDMMVTES